MDKREYLAADPAPVAQRDGRYCTIELDLDRLNIRARVRDNKLVLDVPDSSLQRVRTAVVTEVDGLLHALRIAQ